MTLTTPICMGPAPAAPVDVEWPAVSALKIVDLPLWGSPMIAISIPGL